MPAQTRTALVVAATAGVVVLFLAAGSDGNRLPGYRVGEAFGIQAQPEVTGTWNAVVNLGTGSGEVVFVLEQTGEALTGTYRGVLGSAGITGTVRGQRIEFSFLAEEGSATYTGRITQEPEGMRMEGRCDYSDLGAGNWRAARARDPR